MPDPASPNILDLARRTALVTGAGEGVGAETARYLAAHGAKVVVNDYVPERAAAVAGEIRAAGGIPMAAPADVCDFDLVREMVDTTSSEFGTIDVLVNNAGSAGADARLFSAEPFWETDPSEWEPFVRVNLYGVLNRSRAVLPAMITAGNGGRLITVISDAGRVGEPGLEAYSAAKAGAAASLERWRAALAVTTSPPTTSPSLPLAPQRSKASSTTRSTPIGCCGAM